jgi:preprotein translocase subunit YajC
MITLFNTLAAAAPPTGLQGFFGGPYMLPVLLVVMFYFLILRPQQRQRKEQAARMAALKNGAKVITTAGLHGIVHNVKDTTVMVKVAEGTIRFRLQQGIQGRLNVFFPEN